MPGYDRFSRATRNGFIDYSIVAPPPSKRFKRFGGVTTIVREPQVDLRQREEWRNWNELTIKVRNVALADANTYAIWQAFSLEGNVSFVEIFVNRNGLKDGNALVRFSPPPYKAFWGGARGKYLMQGSQSRYYVEVELLSRGRRGGQVQSPVKRGVWYDPVLRVVAARLHFGIMIEPTSMMPLHVIESDSSRLVKSILLEVDLLRHRMKASFHVEFFGGIQRGPYDRVNRYMLQIPFASLEKIQRMEIPGTDNFALVISLKSPPQFYRKREETQAGHTDEGLRWSEFDTWYRQTDVVYNPHGLRTKEVALHKDASVIDIGRWTTYLFEFAGSTIPRAQYDTMKQALQDFNIEIETIDPLNKEVARPADLWSLIDPPISQNASADLQSLQHITLPFEVRYQLEVCISHELLNEYNITAPFINKLAVISSQDPAKARDILEWVDKEGQRIYDPMSLFQNEKAMSASFKTEIPHYCAYSRKATITPSTIYFSSPTVETTNRVLRHYSRENQDGRFLRVQFTDEREEGRINACAEKSRNDELFTRVFRTLYNGIQVGDRHYQFLAFGNSQFRENGAYFFCPTDHLTCNDIRQWMGNFSSIKVVAKYAARLGQCFSTTRAINGLSKPDLVRIPDIEIKDENDKVKHTFTDGVGKISPFLAQMIAAELGVRSNVAPSAFQFRLGGAKGILVVWPDAKEREVHLRPSQQKFPAVYNGLEIIRCARFSTATLNRQTITILSSLGVTDDVFIRMLTEQLANYQSAMSNDELAITLLLRYIDENSMTINIATMIRNGFMAERDPFVLSLLHLWRSWSIKLLKEKAKIIVENGAFLLGCVDETNTLKGYKTPSVAPGEPNIEEELPEIFIQVPDKEDQNKYNVIEGICLVGRNPSLHPGDLRVVRAVDVKALYHLRDVVVFPQNGERDIPSMCSGGDLDGDDYFVIWDKDLLPREWNCTPMSYNAPTPKNLHRPVEITDLMKFFVRFMKNDSLPTIAHAHLALTDFLDNSVKDVKCLELAELHSKAVDYVKTGEPAQMPKRLIPPKWPHFMEKKHKPKEAQYHSTKILGQLYDKVEMVNFVPQYAEPFDKRILRAYALDDALLKTVRQVKSQYDTAMKRLMAQQEIKTEFEIWSTFVLSRPRVGSDYKIQEEIGRMSEGLKEQFRTVCRERAGGKTFDVLGPFVAGMYKVTKEEMDMALAECRQTRMVGGVEKPKRKMEPGQMPLMSFPWLFEKELGRIATGIEVFDDPQDSGLAPLNLNDGKRKRQGGAAGSLDIEDFIQQEDGVIIHRGEELDLFRHDDSDEFGAGSEDSIHSDHDDHDLVMGDNGEVVLATEFRLNRNAISTQELSGTGVEEVVPITQMDGFIDPRDAGQFEATSLQSSYYDDWHRSSSTESPVIVESQSSPISVPSFEQDSPQESPRNAEPDAREIEKDFIHLNLKESSLEKLAPTMNSGTALSKEIGRGFGEQAVEVKSMDFSVLKDDRKPCDKDETEEEVVELKFKQSPLEKLTRMVGTDVDLSRGDIEAEDAHEGEEEVVDLDTTESSVERLVV